MSWMISEFKFKIQPQEMMVVSRVREMALYTWAYDAESFEAAFKDNIKDIPKSNCFSAEFMYKVKSISKHSVQVWKLKTNGDFNYKMFQLDFIKS